VKYTITHAVRLTASAPVWEHHCELRVAPSPTPHQKVHSVAVTVEPEAEVRTYRDGFGNEVIAFDLMAPHDKASVTVRAVVETTLANPFDFPPVAPASERAWITEALQGQPRLWDYLLHRSPVTPALASLELEVPGRDPGKPLLVALQAVTEWSAAYFELADTVGPTATLADALRAEAVDAQALAHLLICVARAWGAPARFVRGYRDPSYLEDDAEQAMYAWAEILVPGAGWRGLDPCTGLVTNDTYVTVATGRDALDCPPVRSACKGGAEPAKASAVEVRGEQ
jgi:transglutaminase-like putative cysteine protease